MVSYGTGYLKERIGICKIIEIILCILILVFLHVDVSSWTSFNDYNESMVGLSIADRFNCLPLTNEKTFHPDDGREFVIFRGENGEDIYGYIGTEWLLSMSDCNLRFDVFNIFGHNYENDVIFTLYSRAQPNGSIVDINSANLTKHFNSSKKTKIFTHGWLSSGSGENCRRIKNNYLNISDYNVIILDWSAIAGNVFYPIPMAATVGISKYLAAFLIHLVANMGVDPMDVHLIGHSLGAHISGFAGQQLNGTLSRITGLDPALPGFNLGLVHGGHLNKNNAQFVDVIHTCAGYLGYKEPLGHVDFYPNGGTFPQPGCGIIKFFEACSHAMSWKIFAESIISRTTFVARECSSLEHLDEKDCQGQSMPIGDPTPPDAKGIFYLSTAKAVDLLQ